jgi:hypothetical protein
MKRAMPASFKKALTFIFVLCLVNVSWPSQRRPEIRALVKGRAFGSPLARGLYPRVSTAEVDPRAMPGAPAAVGKAAGPAGLPARIPGTAARAKASQASLKPLPDFRIEADPSPFIPHADKGEALAEFPFEANDLLPLAGQVGRI